MSHPTLQRPRFESPNCPEYPCFKQFSDVYTGWEGACPDSCFSEGSQESRTHRRSFHYQARRKAITGGAPCSSPASSHPPRHFRLFYWGETEPQTAYRTCSRTCYQQVLESWPSLGPPSNPLKRKDVYEVSPAGSDPTFGQSQGLSNYLLYWGQGVGWGGVGAVAVSPHGLGWWDFRQVVGRPMHRSLS